MQYSASLRKLIYQMYSCMHFDFKSLQSYLHYGKAEKRKKKNR